MCHVIIYEGSNENSISKASVKALGLKMKPHLTPCRIAWIKKGVETHFNERCQMPFFIRKFNKGEVLYDVIVTASFHVLLGRL